MKVQIAPTVGGVGTYEQVTGLSTVKTLADGVNVAGAAVPIPTGKGVSAIIQAEGQVVRWLDNGEDPTATKGMRIAAGGELYYDGDLASLKFIEENAGAKLNVSYRRNA